MNTSAVTDAEIGARRDVVEGDQLAQLTRAQEAGLDALTDNTNALVDLSNKFADWSARNPLQAAAGSSIGSLLGGVIGGRVTSGAAFTAARTAVGNSSVGQAVMNGGRAIAAGARGLGGAILGGAGLVGLAAGGAVLTYTDSSRTDYDEGQMLRDHRARRGATGGGSGTVTQVSLTSADHAAIGAQTANALRAQPLTATVSPTDATHAAQQQPVATPPAR
jgi:hypothetical protein